MSFIVVTNLRSCSTTRSTVWSNVEPEVSAAPANVADTNSTRIALSFCIRAPLHRDSAIGSPPPRRRVLSVWQPGSWGYRAAITRRLKYLAGDCRLIQGEAFAKGLQHTSNSR